MGDFCKLKIRDLHLNGGFSKRKRLIFTEIDDSRRENARFSLKWGICEEKTRDFQVKWGISEEKTRDFLVKWKIPEEKGSDFCLNGGFVKRKRVFFA